MRIAVIPNLHNEAAAALYPGVCQRLRQAGAQVLEATAPGTLPAAAAMTAALEACDIAVAIGGDGTIVRVVKAAAALDRPVLGVNGGHLGFLAGLEKDELDSLPLLLTGEYTIELRTLLDVTVHKAGQTQVYSAINEAVVSRGALSRLLELHVTADGKEILACRGDGVILATPTGSTAYSLSAGGPVVDPAVDCMLLTPVCPHTVASRPVILPATATVTVRAAAPDGDEAFLTVDGEENIAFSAADSLTVRRAPKAANLIRLKDTTFYDVLEQKMLGRRML